MCIFVCLQAQASKSLQLHNKPFRWADPCPLATFQVSVPSTPTPSCNTLVPPSSPFLRSLHPLYFSSLSFTAWRRSWRLSTECTGIVSPHRYLPLWNPLYITSSCMFSVIWRQDREDLTWVAPHWNKNPGNSMGPVLFVGVRVFFWGGFECLVVSYWQAYLFTTWIKGVQISVSTA